MRRSDRITWLAGVLLAALLLNGCVGYRLGTSLPPDIRSVHVPTFLNGTEEPQLETETTAAAIREFVRDGTLRVANADQADTVVTVTLTSFRLTPVRYEKEESRTTREYRMEIGAMIDFRKPGDEAPLLTRKVVGDTTFFPGGDIGQAKRDALPAASRDLAHKIVECVVEFW